jgi:hypothetical protein
LPRNFYGLSRVIAISFTIIYLFNLIGHYPVFLIRQQVIQDDLSNLINRGIAKGTLTVLSFDQQEINALNWTRKNEFRFMNNMYDVVLMDTDKDGTIRFYCIIDTKEKELIANFEKHISRNMESAANHQRHEQNLYKNLIKDYFLPDKVTSYTTFVNEFKYDWLIFLLISVTPETQIPPPKIFS